MFQIPTEQLCNCYSRLAENARLSDSNGSGKKYCSVRSQDKRDSTTGYAVDEIGKCVAKPFAESTVARPV